MKKAEVKFESGNKVWLIKDYKAIEMTVQEARISIDKDKIEVDYYLLDDSGKCDYVIYSEKHLHESRESLIGSL